MNLNRVLVPFLAFVIGASGVGITMTIVHDGNSRPPTSSNSGMGMMSTPSGLMGPGSDIARGAAGGFVPAQRMEALALRVGRLAHRTGATIYYSNSRVTVVALGSPGTHPGMYWQIDGVNRPTVSVPARSTITVDFADGDPGQVHGFELTTASPPYSRMAMMDGQVAASGAFVMPVPAPQGKLWYATTTSFSAPPPGTYYIICPVPGHAQQGMWLRFIVR